MNTVQQAANEMQAKFDDRISKREEEMQARFDTRMAKTIAMFQQLLESYVRDKARNVALKSKCTITPKQQLMCSGYFTKSK